MVLGVTSGLQPTRLVVILLGIVGGCTFVANGALLTFRPDLFLRFLDWQNPGDHVGRAGAWRKDVYNLEYKLLGIMFVLFGLFVLGFLAKVLWRS